VRGPRGCGSLAFLRRQRGVLLLSRRNRDTSSLSGGFFAGFAEMPSPAFLPFVTVRSAGCAAACLGIGMSTRNLDHARDLQQRRGDSDIQFDVVNVCGVQVGVVAWTVAPSANPVPVILTGVAPDPAGIRMVERGDLRRAFRGDDVEGDIEKLREFVVACLLNMPVKPAAAASRMDSLPVGQVTLNRPPRNAV